MTDGFPPDLADLLAVCDLNAYRMLRPAGAGAEPDLDETLLIARSEATDPDKLRALASHPQAAVRCKIAANPAAPVDALEGLLTEAIDAHNTEMLYALQATMPPNRVLPAIRVRGSIRRSITNAATVVRYLARKGTREDVQYATVHGDTPLQSKLVSAALRGGLPVGPAELATYSPWMPHRILSAAGQRAGTPFPRELATTLIRYYRSSSSAPVIPLLAPLDSDTVDELLAAAIPALSAAIATAANATTPAVTLTVGQIDTLARHMTPAIAGLLTRSRSRRHLTPQQLWAAIDTATALHADTATEIAYESGTRMPETTLAKTLQYADATTRRAWLSGKLPVQPTLSAVVLFLQAYPAGAADVAQAATSGALHLAVRDLAQVDSQVRALLVENALDQHTAPFPAELAAALSLALDEGTVKFRHRDRIMWLTPPAVDAFLATGDPALAKAVALAAKRGHTVLTAAQLSALVHVADDKIVKCLLSGDFDLTGHYETLLRATTKLPDNSTIIDNLGRPEDEPALLRALLIAPRADRTNWLLGKYKPKPTEAQVRKLAELWAREKDTSLASNLVNVLEGHVALTGALCALLNTDVVTTVEAAKKSTAGEPNAAAAYLLRRLTDRFDSNPRSWRCAVGLAETLATGTVDEWLDAACGLAADEDRVVSHAA